MVTKSELGMKHHRLWGAYSTIVRVVYAPFGLLLCCLAIFQTVGLAFTIIGIPVAVVIAKSLGTYFNPVNKKCVHQIAADELRRRRVLKGLR